jgi:hypothetical protein
MATYQEIISQTCTLVDDGEDGAWALWTARLIYDPDRPGVVTLTSAIVGATDPHPCTFPRHLLDLALRNGDACDGDGAVEIDTERVHRDHDLIVFRPWPGRADSQPIAAQWTDVEAFLQCSYRLVACGQEAAQAGLAPSGGVDWDAAVASLTGGTGPAGPAAGPAGGDASNPTTYRRAS